MDTTITQHSPVEYELELTATADELKPELDKALRSQRKRTQMKGFRAGKVPLPMVKRMYGEALGYQLAEQKVQEVYNAEVLDSGDYDVLGQPALTTLDYTLDGDLRAVIRFGVRPEVELKDLAGEQVETLAYEVTDEEVEAEVERLRERHADLVPVEDDPITEEHLIQFDLQELDLESSTPIIGKKDEDQQIFLGADEIDEHPMLSELKKAVLGAKAGDAVRFMFSHDVAHGEHPEGHEHVHRFEVTINEVKRRELPELDDAFVGEVTDDQLTSVDELRDEIRTSLENAWSRQTREFLENNITERMLDLHTVPVPSSVVDMYVDSFVEDVKSRNEGELPANFDETAFRAANRGNAEQQARWMLIRDRVIEVHELEVEEDDYEAFFEREAQGDGRISAEQMKQFYRQMPRLMEQLEQRLLSEKVYATLAEQFEVVEKTRDELEAEAEARSTAADTPAAEETPEEEPAADADADA